MLCLLLLLLLLLLWLLWWLSVLPGLRLLVVTLVQVPDATARRPWAVK